MSLHTIDIQIEDPYRSRGDGRNRLGTQVQPTTLQQAAEATLQHEHVEEPCELVVVVTGDETLHQLNRRHRNIDAPTDVLAFPHQTKGPTPFVFLETARDTGFDGPRVDGRNRLGTPRYLGDVIISFPRAEAQAVDAGNELLAELQLLVVHGVLHLLGHDDETEPERARMWQAQQAILDEINVEVHLPD